ncbi:MULTISPECIES: AmiS/UreI family transporter [Brevibacillus]|uniref:Transporter n=1 Tax=Brevibacillus invocatus TaxID=173959 RepID=A0A3M8CKR6_9BACL|nr:MULTISPECIES: AmiS/UreI family transporter [Brevibacillus]MCM3078345.1 AmiS/UreI family transporter [Brevibacillus invocatus]MCM3428500.1 AmiS/UreI family transporter [Brevibacillus invocatus]MDH4616868.1 AmiS/UreI family transporter [Brevibacillus sp. AY1]RNB76141.1 transporter [Brevibacillus invocatus]
MSDVGLLYVGGVLFLNSIMLLGRVEGKSAGIFNLFVGVLQVITPLYLIFQAKGDTAAILGASGIFLFGFTYLYVGITNLCKLDTTGVGWYSLWVAILAIGYSLVNFMYFGDIKFGIIWLMWSFLWTLFFILLGLKRDIGRYTGFVTLIQSWITATVPAFLSLVGVWQGISLVWVWLVTLVAVVAFVYLYGASKKSQVTDKVTM